MTPVVARTAAEVRTALSARRTQRDRVALVPTLGALHAGHAALIDAARQAAPVTAVSIFVNPLQFGPSEDFERYPRTFDADLEMCAEHVVDVVFAPGRDEMYPGGTPQVTIDPGPLGAELEGSVRPGHFEGVLTVVSKLFHQVAPDVAVFGEKDYQQLLLIRQMVRDLAFPVDIAPVATVREADGLALSSRNRYLSPDDRRTAAAIPRAITAGAAAASYGVDAALGAARDVLTREPSIVLDYLAARGTDLGPAPRTGDARLLVAARVGGTRLIDNVPMTVGEA